MDDDVRQSSTDRYAVSQAYRWRAERDQARQEMDRLRGEVEAMRQRLMPEGVEWLLEVWPRWSNGDYCRFGDWWTAECYGEFEPKQLRKLSIYTPEQLDEFGQGNGKDYGYEWDFFRPSYVTYHPVKVEPPAPKVLAADGEPLLDGDEVWMVKDGIGPYHVQEVRDGVSVCVGETHCEFRPDELTHRAPVIAADGRPLRDGETVWTLDNPNFECVVFGFGNGMVHLKSGVDHLLQREPSQLTHQRPVMDADGNRIEPAMDVWWMCEGDELGIHAERLHVESIGDDGFVTCSPFNGGTWVELEPSELYVHKPVLDADGVPIKKGDTVWRVNGDGPFTATEYRKPWMRAKSEDGHETGYWPDDLTHTKPELDTWEKVEHDAKAIDEMIDSEWGGDPTDARDLVRRAKKLAGVSE